ncbi:unnamed protein product [Mucor hiemalis]
MASLDVPPPPLLHSVSTSTTDLYASLFKTQIPDRELNELLHTQDSLTEEQVEYQFNEITTTIMKWLEVAHMTAFTIEQNLKRQQIEDIEPLLLSCSKMAPLIPLLIELNEIIHDETTVIMTKIQSEWSGLQHFISSVKKAMEESNEKVILLSLMSNILFQIDDLSVMIFQYQEKRHIQATMPIVEGSTNGKEDSILIQIDNTVGPLFNNVEKVYTRMISSPPEDTSGLLTRKHLLVQERWESLRVEIDELKVELKEDRWLIVFKQVADQADGMMDRLDKTVSQCYTMIQQIKDGLSTSNSTSTTTSNSSYTSTTTTTPTTQMEKLRSIEMNFDAKYKYYTPSVTKMLMMLGNGIAARVSRNTATLNRHEAMIARWNSLKSTMDHLRKKDLPDISTSSITTNNNTRPMSPATTVCWSRLSDRSNDSNTSNFLMKSPEPAIMERSRSPYVSSSVASSSPISFMDDYLHHRSKTPTKRDHHLWPHMTNKSPSPVYGRSQQMSPLSREKRSNLVPSTSDSKSYFASKEDLEEEEEENDEFVVEDFRRRQPTPQLLLQQQQQQKIIPRSKSSLSTSTRSMTPSGNTIRRSGTPSLIPRPKTPTANSLIPRPKTPNYKVPRTLTTPRTSSPMIPTNSGKYKPNPKDPLDKEIGLIINSSPIPIQCQKAAVGQHEGRYYFGNELTPSLGGGKKIYTCKLMTYENNQRNNQTTPKRNKVLIRVGGGWQDLEIFLLEHMNLMGG